MEVNLPTSINWTCVTVYYGNPRSGEQTRSKVINVLWAIHHNIINIVKSNVIYNKTLEGLINEE